MSFNFSHTWVDKPNENSILDNRRSRIFLVCIRVKSVRVRVHVGLRVRLTVRRGLRLLNSVMQTGLKTGLSNSYSLKQYKKTSLDGKIFLLNKNLSEKCVQG